MLSIAQLWALSKAWYSNRLDFDYMGRTVDEAQQIFAQLGLNTPFWQSV